MLQYRTSIFFAIGLPEDTAVRQLLQIFMQEIKKDYPGKLEEEDNVIRYEGKGLRLGRSYRRFKRYSKGELHITTEDDGRYRVEFLGSLGYYPPGYTIVIAVLITMGMMTHFTPNILLMAAIAYVIVLACWYVQTAIVFRVFFTDLQDRISRQFRPKDGLP